MSLLHELDHFLQQFGFKHFAPHEITDLLDPPNQPPPQQIWNNIIPTLVLLDYVRENSFPYPLKVDSSYRSYYYNSNTPGSSGVSQHMAFRALDVKPLPDRGNFFKDEYNREQTRLVGVLTKILRDLRALSSRPEAPWISLPRFFPVRLFVDRLGVKRRGYEEGGSLPIYVSTPGGEVPAEPLECRFNEEIACHQFRFRGGIGRYRTFVHVDTRGRNAYWEGGGV